jgi:hypothetical protein
MATLFLIGALVLPTMQPAFAASPGRIADVGLSGTGRLVGQLVDTQGRPVVNSAVEISKTGEKPTLATTNELGYFAVDNLQAGVYVASAAGTVQMVRVWAPRTAPPAASNGLLMVQPENTVRAQAGLFGNVGLTVVLVGLGIGGGIWAIVANNPSS